MIETNEDLDAALRYDSMAEAEKMTGKDYHVNVEVGMLGMFLMQQQRQEREALLFLNQDTIFSSASKDFIRIVESMGFKRIYEEKTCEVETLYVWWRDGILLDMMTWNGERVNTTNAHLEYCGPRGVLASCTNQWVKETTEGKVWQVRLDAREGFRHRLDTMAANGKFMPTWHKTPFLWWVTYKEQREEGYDYEVITSARIAKLPQEFQAIILCNHP